MRSWLRAFPDPAAPAYAGNVSFLRQLVEATAQGGFLVVRAVVLAVLIIIGLFVGVFVYLEAETAQKLRADGIWRLDRHDQCGVCMSPDAELLAAMSSDGEIGVWCTSEQRRIAVVSTGLKATHFYRSLAVSDQGNRLAYRALDGSICIVGFTTDHERQFLPAGGDTSSDDPLLFSPAGDKLAVATSGGNRGVIVWNLPSSSQAVIDLSHRGFLRSMAFSVDGHHLTIGTSDGEVDVCSSLTGETEKSWAAHGYDVNGVAFSRDGRMLATASSDGTAVIWEIANCRKRQVFEHGIRQCASVAFSPDGQQLLTVDHDGLTRLWDCSTGACKATRQGRWSVEYVARFNGKGPLVACDSVDGLLLWPVAP